MARFDRLTVYQRAIDCGVIPLFDHTDSAIARQVAWSVARGGASFLEFRNRGDQALRVFADLNEYITQAGLPLILGAGTILDAPTAALYIAHGANFIVCPNLNPEIIRLCNRRKIACIPGCATPSEISTAEELGAEIVKIFPGDSIGGPNFIKAVLGPMPWSKLMPTGGVEPTFESVTAWIKAGAACLGMGSRFISKDVIAAGAFDVLEQRSRDVHAWVQQARG